MGRFQNLLEEIDAIVEDRPPVIMESKDLDEAYDSIDLSEDWGEEWTPATSVVWISSMLEMFDGEMSEDESDELVSMLIEAAYKWSQNIQPDEKDVSPDIGTIDEPAHGGLPKRGYRGAASGLTPAMERGIIKLVTQAAENPPGFVAKAKVENAVEIWQEAAGKAINKGIGWSMKTDKKTGLQYPVPSYGTIERLWRAMVSKATGFEPTASANKTIAKDIEEHTRKAAKDMAKGAAKIGKGAARRASSVMRGARQK